MGILLLLSFSQYNKKCRKLEACGISALMSYSGLNYFYIIIYKAIKYR